MANYNYLNHFGVLGMHWGVRSAHQKKLDSGGGFRSAHQKTLDRKKADRTANILKKNNNKKLNSIDRKSIFSGKTTGEKLLIGFGMLTIASMAVNTVTAGVYAIMNQRQI